MRKAHLFLILTMLWSATLTSNAWWFWDNDSDDDDNQQQVVEQQKQEINRLQNEVDETQHSKDNWQMVAFIMGIDCCGCLICGAAMGSYARRNLREEHQ